MKPRTKLQREVKSLSESLPRISEKLEPWAIETCTAHIGYATKKRVVCMDCGGRFESDLVVRKRATCPHCETKLQIIVSRQTTNKQTVYYATAEVHGEFQVIRNFVMYSYHKADKKARYCTYEVLQHWLRNDGKHEVVARNHTLNWYCDSWNGNMEIRKEYRPYWSNSASNKYDVYPMRYHPEAEFMPKWKMYGINSKLQGLTFMEAVSILPVDSQAETLIKAKQFALLGECRRGKIGPNWPSIKICLRNKYKVNDATLYLDYLDLLRYFRKDLHNAHYVCPKNLKREHDRLVEKKRKEEELKSAERKRIKQLRDEEIFKKLKSMFFGLRFSKGDIEVRVLESVKEHLEEGDRMKHCAFTNEYYLKEHSLIFSALVNGKPTETVEVDLRDLKVVQSRGLQNKNTEYHDEIVKLVNSNMDLIKERIQPKKPIRKKKLQTAAA